MSEKVTVCIPAWRAAAFLEETVESALAQSWPQIGLIISVDRCDDGTEEIARRYERRGKAKVIVHADRLGWVANTNKALGLADTRLRMNLPHDDILDRDYITVCIAALEENPAATVAYSDLHAQGWPNSRAVQLPATGSLHKRLQSILPHQFAAVAMRGVVDTVAGPRYLVPPALGDFAADTLWLFQMASQGALIRVPSVLYRKRVFPGTTFGRWYQSSTDERRIMWYVHCVEILQTITQTLPDLRWSAALERAWVQRIRSGNVFVSGRWEGSIMSDEMLRMTAFAAYHRVRAKSKPYSWCQ